MLKKIKALINENRLLHKKNNLLLKELEWANIYHDSIRGKKCLEQLSLNIGRWAGNYTFFYLLHRILTDYKINSILEFGLGESTKFIATFIDEYSKNTQHTIIEQDESWSGYFQQNFKLPAQSQIELHKIIEKKINGYTVSMYDDLNKYIPQIFDLYVIDGPKGSAHFSRYDIIQLSENFTDSSQFIILFDDYQRVGEQETMKVLLEQLRNRAIKLHFAVYEGVKSVAVVASHHFPFVKSM